MSQDITFDRSYDATVGDLWELWTTKEGFESWWGPEGFRVDVHRIEPRPGGALVYDMIAVGPEQVEFMTRSNMPLSHATHGTFTEVVPQRRLVLTHVIDFIPGVEAYSNRMQVEFSQSAAGARMVIRIEPHYSPEMTGMAGAGMESQLTKVGAALARRPR